MRNLYAAAVFMAASASAQNELLLEESTDNHNVQPNNEEVEHQPDNDVGNLPDSIPETEG